MFMSIIDYKQTLKRSNKQTINLQKKCLKIFSHHSEPFFNKQPGVHRGDGDEGCNYPVKSDESNKGCGLACALASGRLRPDAALLAACRCR